MQILAVNLLLGIAMIGFCAWHVVRALKTGEISGRRPVILKRHERPAQFWADVGSYMILGALGVTIIVMGFLSA